MQQKKQQQNDTYSTAEVKVSFPISMIIVLKDNLLCLRKGSHALVPRKTEALQRTIHQSF